MVIPGRRDSDEPGISLYNSRIPGLCAFRAHPGMTFWGADMQFDTKIAVVIRTDLQAWQS